MKCDRGRLCFIFQWLIQRHSLRLSASAYNENYLTVCRPIHVEPVSIFFCRLLNEVERNSFRLYLIISQRVFQMIACLKLLQFWT